MSSKDFQTANLPPLSAAAHTAYHEMHSWDESSDQVRGASIPQVPLAVVSAGNEGEKPTPGTSPADWEKFLAIWRDLQADLAKRSTNSIHITAAKSSHMIPLDQPAVVVDAIRRVVEAARKHGPLQASGKN